MFETMRSVSVSPSLDDVVERLRAVPEVDGMALTGSIARGDVTPASDVDLVVVTDGSERIAPSDEGPFEVVFTQVGDRPADVIVTTTALLAEARHEPLGRWLTEGRTLLDRSGAIASFVDRVRRDPVAPSPAGAAYRSWWSVSFEVTKAERYEASGDASYREAATWIAATAVGEALVAYFTVRDLPWEGQRRALAHWAARDAAFLELVRDFFASPERAIRSGVVRNLADRALAPAGGVWEPGARPRSETWERLVGG